MESNSWTILLLAFSTGLLHALDADHVMAVSAIAAKRSGLKAIVRLCLNWSFGHGATLLVFAVSILLLGLSIPYSLSHYAEQSVALVLIIIGLWIIRDLYRSKAHLHFHHHDGLTEHAHWHVHNNKAQLQLLIHPKYKNSNKTYSQHDPRHDPHYDHGHDHSAVMVGVIHGLAGLAPLLAIIPFASQSAWLAIVYLFIFCIGVFLSMLIFGGVLGKLLEYLQHYGMFPINLIRGVVAIASISLGLTWLS